MASTTRPPVGEGGREAYANLLANHLQFILDRYERDPGFPFVDTKIVVSSCEDFATADRSGTPWGRDVVYGWVQGRAMESLAGHIEWLRGRPDLPAEAASSLERRAQAALSALVPAIEAVRRRNNGRMTFMFRTDGQPLQVGADGEMGLRETIRGDANFSDLFASKGLFAAGRTLDNPEFCDAGRCYFRRVSDAIEEERFASDQEPLNPRNPPPCRPGRRAHGPAMISLGGVAALVLATGEEFWVQRGCDVIGRILDRHVNRADHDGMQPWDFVEFVTKDGAAWEEEGRVVCDPGHALEFVGLATKFLLATKAAGCESSALRHVEQQCRTVLPNVLVHVFEVGFNGVAGGITKTVDLKSRRAINDECPGWSLPETIRACGLLQRLFAGHATAGAAAIGKRCRESFFANYLNPDCHFLPYQVRTADGRVAETVAGFPDIDPAYHTGLSLLDVL